MRHYEINNNNISDNIYKPYIRTYFRHYVDNVYITQTLEVQVDNLKIWSTDRTNK